MIKRLQNERGITLLEILVTSIILAFAMISIFMGIIYAEKQMQRNYHDRVATLAASGELDWQKYYLANYKEFNLFSTRQIKLEELAKGKILYGNMSVKRADTFESPFGLNIPYTVLEATVSWQEPGDKTTRSIVVREDFY
jgi:hypothetical protein